MTILLGVGLFVGGVMLSLGLVVVVLVHMPEDYFCGDGRDSIMASRPLWKRIATRVGKNALGVLLILLGVLLSLPGVPGQGVLTILIGITLVDLPGKRKLEIRIMRNRTVLNGANAIRRRFHKPPFGLDLNDAPPLPSKPAQ